MFAYIQFNITFQAADLATLESVCRRLFGPRNVNAPMFNRIKDMIADRTHARERDRERERQHVRGEARPLFASVALEDNDLYTQNFEDLLLPPNFSIINVITPYMLILTHVR